MAKAMELVKVAAFALLGWYLGCRTFTLPRSTITSLPAAAAHGQRSRSAVRLRAEETEGGVAAWAIQGLCEQTSTCKTDRKIGCAPTSPGSFHKHQTEVRVGLIHIPGMIKDFRSAFEKLNVTNETYFQTEVPEAFQLPLATKLLAMSNTVDVVVVVQTHRISEQEQAEILRGFQTVALTTNVPVVPCNPSSDLDSVADTAVQMAEIRQQALMGGGPRRSIFFGIGANKTGGDAGKKGKIYF
ncbi:unnamed protein product [Effrenium voratum]|nr:unnamed protein product [Effrenium voratum]